MDDNLTKKFEELSNLYSSIRDETHGYKDPVNKSDAQEELNRLHKLYDDSFDQLEKEVFKAGKEYLTERDKGNNPIKPSVISMKENELELTGQPK